MGEALVTGTQQIVAGTQAARNPKVLYKGIQMEWDYYENGQPALHIICPRCAQFGLLSFANKKFHVDEQNRVSIDEPFRCDYCLHRFGVTNSRMFDA